MNTPDTEWESGYDAMVEDARLYSDFPDPLAKHIKGYVRKELSSRDTYWKESFKQLIQKNRQIKISNNKDITDGWDMALLNLQTALDYPDAITNEDNLK